MATVTDGIGVETVVRSVDEQRVIAVNIDGARSRPAPREVNSVSSLHLVATRTERDPCWSGSRGCSCSRCSRRRCRTCGLSVMEGVLLGTAADRNTPIHPRTQVLVWRGAAIVVVAGIGRLDPRIRLGGQR